MSAEVALPGPAFVAGLAELSRDELVDLGRRVASFGQWALGDLAAAVQTAYGEADLEMYAEEIGVEYATLKDYRRVSRAYPAEKVGRSTNSWAVYRAFASLAEKDRFDLVTRQQPWTYREARELAAERRTPRQVTPKPPPAVVAPEPPVVPVEPEPPASDADGEKPASDEAKPPGPEPETAGQVPATVTKPDPGKPDSEPVKCPGCAALEEANKRLTERVKALEEANKRLTARLSAPRIAPEREHPPVVPQETESHADSGPCARCGQPGVPVLIVLPDGAEDTAYACDPCLAVARRRQPEVRFTRPEPVTTQAELDGIYAGFSLDLETP